MRIPPLADFLPPVLSCCRDLGEVFGFSGDDMLRIEVALEEAVTAVLEEKLQGAEEESPGSGAGAVPQRRSRPSDEVLTLQFRRVPLGMRVVLGNFRTPLTRESLESYSPSGEPDENAMSGLGLFLMRNLVDKVALYDHGEEGRGRELHLFKMLRRERNVPEPGEALQETASGYGDAPEAPRAPCTPPPASVRSFKTPARSGRVPDSHVAEIASAFSEMRKKCGKEISPAQLLESLLDPDISLFAAWGESDELLAVQATERYSFRHSLLLALPPLFSEDAEENACSALLLDSLIEHAEKQAKTGGILGFVPGKAGGNSALFASRWFSECAILPAPPGNSFLKANGEAGMGVFRLSPSAGFPPGLYAPKRYHSLLRSIYKEESNSRKFDFEHPGEPLRQRSVISATAELQGQRCDLFLHDYGLDFLFQLSVLTKQLLRKETRNLVLHLSMELPSTAAASEDAEKLGYVFCGVLPGTPGGDQLLYIHRDGLQRILEKIEPATETGRALVYTARKETSKTRLSQGWNL
jgi:hypothetical protein